MKSYITFCLFWLLVDIIQIQCKCMKEPNQKTQQNVTLKDCLHASHKMHPSYPRTKN